MSELDPVDILLVEDNPLDAELTLAALAEHRFANPIIVLDDGAKALDFLFARGAYAGRAGLRPPRVVILDLKLPKVDGIEVLRELKADPVTRLVPVVVLTSSREESDVLETYALGVNSYIVKPVEFENFAAAVKGLGFYWLLLNQPPS